MIRIVRTSSENKDFIHLVKMLDEELAERDGEEHSFYHQFNKIEGIKYAVVLDENGEPLGCGAIKPMDSSTMEVKRMYIVPHSRGKGLATRILSELEKWAAEMHNKACVLETGKRQPEAIALYVKNGYQTIPNFGPYKGVQNSVCFKKSIQHYV